jgi:la-related protein 1
MTFSYAQAAKGLSTSSPAASALQQPSGSITPVKEPSQPNQAPPVTPNGSTWTEDVEERALAGKDSEDNQVKNSNPSTTSSTNKSSGNQAQHVSAASSPEFGTSSSTLGNNDDVTSLPASSESTWENKSQTSNAVEKPLEKADIDQEKDTADNEENDKPVPKPAVLQDAPIPTVNIWKLRADGFAKKAAQSVNTKPRSAVPVPNSTSNKAENSASSSKADVKQRGDGTESGSSSARDKRQNTGMSRRSREDTYPSQRQRQDYEGRKGGAGKQSEKDDRNLTRVAVIPKDQESWPTPEIAHDEERKRAEEKGDRQDRERTATNNNKPHGKTEWVHVPHTPTVVFNTPMPAAASRRGRGGARGGATNGSRAAAHNVSGASSTEKDTSAPKSAAGDGQKRNKADGSTAREPSPTKNNVNTGPLPGKDQKALSSGERNTIPRTNGTEPSFAKKSSPEETAQVAAYSNKHPQTHRSKQRKTDAPTLTERRRESDIPMSAQDKTSPVSSRRASTAANIEGQPFFIISFSSLLGCFPFIR